MNRLLEDYEVVLVDMHRTFMFDVDRFDDDQDFAAAYRANGGSRLSDIEVRRIIRETNRLMLAEYHDPAKYEDFPQVVDTLARLGVPESEFEPLVAAYATHECGYVPHEHAMSLHALASERRLGVVSNIFAPKQYWHAELLRAGLLDIIEVFVASSDHRFMKPSPKLFDVALAHFGVSPERVVHIGDSYRCDVQGAAGAGIDVIWIDEETHRRGEPAPPAKRVIPSLVALTCPPTGPVGYPG